MRFFEEMEKCFPEMRKHHMEWVNRNPTLSEAQSKTEMILWIKEHDLQEHSRIYQLFLKAGVESRLAMANEMLIWHICDWRLKKAE